MFNSDDAKSCDRHTHRQTQPFTVLQLRILAIVYHDHALCRLDSSYLSLILFFRHLPGLLHYVRLLSLSVPLSTCPAGRHRQSSFDSKPRGKDDFLMIDHKILISASNTIFLTVLLIIIMNKMIQYVKPIINDDFLDPNAHSWKQLCKIWEKLFSCTTKGRRLVQLQASGTEITILVTNNTLQQQEAVLQNPSHFHAYRQKHDPGEKFIRVYIHLMTKTNPTDACDDS